MPTPHQILGPYFPVATKPAARADLTTIEGRKGHAEGEVIEVRGRVLNRDGMPVEGAKLVIWQANCFGRYRHPNDTNTAPWTKNSNGFAEIVLRLRRYLSDQDREARRLPGGPDWTRRRTFTSRSWENSSASSRRCISPVKPLNPATVSSRPQAIRNCRSQRQSPMLGASVQTNLEVRHCPRPRLTRGSRKSNQQFVCTGELDGAFSDELTPNPVMVTHDADGIEVGTVIQSMAVSNHDDVVMVGNRRPDRRVDAEIGCPSGNQDPVRRNVCQARLQVGPGERIVQFLPDYNITGISNQIGQKHPARRLRSKSSPLAPQC